MTCNKFWQGSNPSFQPITLRGQIVSASVSIWYSLTGEKDTAFRLFWRKTQPLDFSGMQGMDTD